VWGGVGFILYDLLDDAIFDKFDSGEEGKMDLCKAQENNLLQTGDNQFIENLSYF